MLLDKKKKFLDLELRYGLVKTFVLRQGKVSASLLQAECKLSLVMSLLLLQRLEDEGIISVGDVYGWHVVRRLL